MTEYSSIAVLATVLALAVTFLVRSKDLPQVPEPSPADHLELRKAAVYENLRDLNFEYRVGKLSDADYQRTKLELQSELANVLAEIDRLNAESPGAVKARPEKPAAAVEAGSGTVCPHCKATFDKPLRFCGECGKAMVKAG